MRFAGSPRRPRGESIVPMINVVFLLLIFFLMTAQIAPPEPFAVELPDAEAEGAAGRGDVLHVSGNGEFAYRDARGAAVLAALAGRGDPDAALLIRADAGLDATVLAELVPRLAALGVREAKLLTVAR
jgi:biopolymer transport protein ExbD